MHDTIIEMVKARLKFRRGELEHLADEIEFHKEEIVRHIADRNEITKEIEQYELFLIENGVNPKVEEVEK